MHRLSLPAIQTFNNSTTKTSKRGLTACSRTSSLGLMSSRTKIGTAPFSITTRVWSLVPLAMLVSAHADSNCKAGLSSRWRNSTNFGTTPASITFWIGGLRSGKTIKHQERRGTGRGKGDGGRKQTNKQTNTGAKESGKCKKDCASCHGHVDVLRNTGRAKFNIPDSQEWQEGGNHGGATAAARLSEPPHHTRPVSLWSC